MSDVYYITTLKEGHKYTVHKANEATYYIQCKYGFPVYCSCPDHQYRNRFCKHMEMLLAEKHLKSSKPVPKDTGSYRMQTLWFIDKTGCLHIRIVNKQLKNRLKVYLASKGFAPKSTAFVDDPGKVAALAATLQYFQRGKLESKWSLLVSMSKSDFYEAYGPPLGIGGVRQRFSKPAEKLIREMH